MNSEDDFGITEDKQGQSLAVTAAALFLLNLLVDVLYTLIDPRVGLQ